jgi:hypothetical protein
MSSLKDKLYNLEATPPANTWERIATALDESHLSDQFPEKLYNLETTPPARAWNAISSQLNPLTEARVIPMRRRVAGFVRYAAAAIIIFIVGYFIFDLSGGNENPSDQNGMVVTQDSSNKSIKPPSVDEQAPNELAIQTTPVEPGEEKKLIASTNTRKNTTESKSAYSNTSRRTVSNVSEATYSYIEHTPNLAERYVMFMNPSGNIIRMSKKLGDMVCCVSGEEQDEDCRDQLKKWQEKIATSPSTSTGGGFMDVWSIVTALENDL